jgi:hypothetical protein
VAIVKARPADDEIRNDVEARLCAALLEAIGTRDVVAVAAGAGASVTVRYAARQQGHRSDP